jgi:hypothetical protein
LEGARGPGGGLLYWQPRPGVFPSGLTRWLGLPLSLYAPAYSAESAYVREGRYGFVVDEVTLGLGRIVTLHHRSSTLHQIH